MDLNYKFKARYICLYLHPSFFFFIDLKDIENKSAEFIDSNTRRQDVDNTYMMYDVCRIYFTQLLTSVSFSSVC